MTKQHACHFSRACDPRVSHSRVASGGAAAQPGRHPPPELTGVSVDAVTTLGDLEGALDRIVESRPELLVLDLPLGTDELHGWDIAQQLRREPSLEALPVVICSADVLALHALIDDLNKTQQVRTLPKPFAIAELTAAIDGLLAEAKASPG